MTGRIGPYRLLKEIGRGGMGTVYLAEREDDFSQRVAIKVVPRLTDADAQRRFKSERKILASLQHSGIAHLVDGGTTPDGVPYFVMEYVDGVAIDRYCDDHALAVRERLELFVRVCEAVSYAHRRLVVHRDLKPSNILVTPTGTPKLLDFGIAKALDADHGDLTSETSRILTPHYASPEQIRGEAITTASDVYSLGVLLFELLTGHGPFELDGQNRRRPLVAQAFRPAERPPGSPEGLRYIDFEAHAREIERIVCGQDPPKPSAVANPAPGRSKELRGDLDTIVLMALRKEPARRYASVDQLADDLKRFLDGRPVAARPATWAYVTQRFVRRHRAAVAAGTAFAVTLAGFAVALAWSAAQARHERDVAERVTSMLIQVFSGSDPRTPRGDTITARELLDRGVEGIRRDLGDQPDVQAQLLDAVGAVYAGLGLSEGAKTVEHEAPEAWTGVGAVDSMPAAFGMWRLAESLRTRGQLAAAEPVARRAFDMTRRLLGPRNPQAGETLNTLSLIVYARGRQDEAERQFVQVTEIFRDSLGPDHPMVATGLRNLAMSRRDRGDFEGAERLLREALAIRRRIFGEASWGSLSILAENARRGGRLDEAERFLRDAVAALRHARHPNLDQGLIALADLLRERGEIEEAAALEGEAHTLADALRGTGR